MQLRSATIFLLLLALVLPVAQGVLYWVALLLGAMQDAPGAAIVGRIVLVCGAVWVIDLVALVIVLALQTLATPPGDRAE